ncbi:MAG: hypothetical protein WC334_01865 [Kiritimatiellales bacterium]
MKTPSQELAKKITERLLSEGLISADAAKQIEPKLAEGKLREEDWRLPIELAGQKQVKALEAQRSEKRRSLFDAQDKVDQQRDELIRNIEGKLTQKAVLDKLFVIRWRLV